MTSVLDYALAANENMSLKQKTPCSDSNNSVDILANAVASKLYVPDVIANGGYLTCARRR